MTQDLFKAMNLEEIPQMPRIYPTTNLYSYERNSNLSYKLIKNDEPEYDGEELPEIIDPPGITDPPDDEIDEDDIEEDDEDEDEDDTDDEDDDETGGYIEIEDDEDDDDDDDKVI
jgi:hypothetical protein